MVNSIAEFIWLEGCPHTMKTKNSKPIQDTSQKPIGKGMTSLSIDHSLSRNEADQEARLPFPVVGIGASAGGLEALEIFFKNFDGKPGMAFVVVEHLDPAYKGILAELLQRSTKLKVAQVTDRMLIERNCVYVIAPNKDLSVLNGVLHLLPQSSPRGLRLPIDFFFRSMAYDFHERSVAVILSGMGSDGSIGIKAIKENGGSVLVQTPASAKFDGMPSSAIATGLADIVANVEDLPQKLLELIQRSPYHSGPEFSLESKSQGVLDKIFILIRVQTGHDFSLYKRSTIYRRVERRMGIHKIDKISTYLRFLQENPSEVDLLFKEFLIGVTDFFRDPLAWEELAKQVLLPLIKEAKDGSTLRAWVPGCSTGEEAYSLAILALEVIEQVNPLLNVTLQIFATDLDVDAVNRARQGLFPASIKDELSHERLHKFFDKEALGYRAGKNIRKNIIFAQQNVVMDPPFTHLDLLICRNLLIYLTPELQKKLIPLFFYCLNPNGSLFLGSAETIGSFTDLFSPLAGKFRIFQRLSQPIKPLSVEFPSSYQSSRSKNLVPLMTDLNKITSIPNLQQLTNQMLLQNFSPSAVLINPDGDVLYVSGRTGKYLELPPGKASWNIIALAREELRYELGNALHKAITTKQTIHIPLIKIGADQLQIIIQPQGDSGELKGTLLVVFQEMTTRVVEVIEGEVPAVDTARVEILTRELHVAREDVRSIREMMQTSQEELRITNEELQSTNEELQSTNEELTTSKEEMQSMNEELQMVNHELESKLEDLSHINNDMKNLLNSTDIATVFLDDHYRIRRFTDQATKIIKLIPGDTGRPITDIASELIYPELVEHIESVMANLVGKEKTVITRNGNWYWIRIIPYRTVENKIDGVVITFMDVTISKKLEISLRESEQEIKALFKHMTNAFVLFESVFEQDGTFADCKVSFVNDAFEKWVGVKSAGLVGNSISEIWPSWERAWTVSCGIVAVSGAPCSMEIVHKPSGQNFYCNVYRPTDNQNRFCMVLEHERGLIDPKLIRGEIE